MTTVAIALAVVVLAREIRALRRVVEALEPWPAAAGALAALEAEADDACVHQQEHRTDASTSGIFRWRCDPKKGGCGFVFERPATQVEYR